jgi:hypothetical protein
MVDYVECPFCEVIFEEDAYPGLVHTRPLDEHIRAVHHRMKIRKGSNYRWVTEEEVRERLVTNDGGRKPNPRPR